MRRARLFQMCRRDLLWLAIGFVVFQLTLFGTVDRWLPQVRDPLFAAKESRLRARLDEYPVAPLAVLLGSSRTQLGFQAARLRGDGSVLAFNFGLPASGPVMELVTLRRLLANGIRPSQLFLEITPMMLALRDGHPTEEDMLNGALLDTAELASVRRYYTRTWRLLKPWAEVAAVPAATRRAELRTEIALDTWKPWTHGGDPFLAMDGYGWQPLVVDPTPEDRERLTGLALRQYQPTLCRFAFAEPALRALHDLLDLCRRERIPTNLYVMPEGSLFRSLYPPDALAKVQALLQNLACEWGVPVIDCRTWVADEHFYDSHHLLPAGAAVFTERFGREVLHPLPHMASAKNPMD
jgi:hypothetical protein